MAQMTELHILKGLQSALADLDLSHEHARECCMGLMSSIERSFDRIKKAEEDADDDAYDARMARYDAETMGAELPFPHFDSIDLIKSIFRPHGAK